MARIYLRNSRVKSLESVLVRKQHGCFEVAQVSFSLGSERLTMNSEEIFDFSSEKMTTHKTTRLKNQFCQEFSEIFQLCTEVLEKAQIESLISATLETTLRFLSWVPLGYIFGTNIVALLHERVYFLANPWANVLLNSFSKCPSSVMSR